MLSLLRMTPSVQLRYGSSDQSSDFEEELKRQARETKQAAQGADKAADEFLGSDAPEGQKTETRKLKQDIKQGKELLDSIEDKTDSDRPKL